MDTARIAEHLGPIAQKDMLLIGDGAKVYAAFAAARGFPHVWIVASKGEHVRQGYYIQNINAYTSGLKTWVVRFRGVANKYLDSYLGWRRQIDQDGDDLPADRWLIAAVA